MKINIRTNKFNSLRLLFVASVMFFMSLNMFAGDFRIKDGETALTINANSYLKLIVNNSLTQFSSVDVKTKAGTFSTLTAEGYGFSETIGNPNLPVLKKLIEVPLDAKFDIRISNQRYTEYDLKDFNILYPLIPTQAPLSKSVTNPDQVEFAYNATTYSANAFSENPLATVTSVGIMRGVNLARLEISPVAYNPVTNKIRVYDNLEVEVVFTGGNVAGTIELRNRTASPYFEGAYQMLANYKPTSTDALITASPVTYVIVSHIMFQAALQPFIQWKTKKGFKVIEAYTNNPLVGTTTTSIKNYLQGLYNNPPAGYNAPSFVLIVGDVAQVPTFNGTAGSHVTDLYYCEYTGNKIPEVFYGRFSATTVAQLQPQIDKTLEYEQYLMPDPSFLNEVVMIAGMDGTYGPLHGNGQINYGTTTYFNAAHGLLSHTYLYPQSGSSSSLIIQNVSNGVGYANYTAHGSSDGWYSPSFLISDIATLQNAHKYPLMVGNCCLTSTFETNCFGEELLRAANKGALGYIGGSNSSYWDEDYWWGCGFKTVSVNPTYNAAHLGAYDVTFHDHGEATNKWYITQGQMVVGGNMAVEESSSSMKTYYWEIYCLMGDPSLSVYFSVPQPVAANYSAALLVGMSSFTVNTEANAYVALSMNGVLLGTGIADVTGVVNLTFAPIAAPGAADIVITAQNRQPHIAQITVAPAEGPYMTLDSYTITDASGNNNGQADYGENITLNVKLNNVGVELATGVNGTLTTSDPMVTVTDGTFTFGDVPAGGSIIGENAFAITIADFITDEHHVSCNLEMTDGTHTWNSTLIITLNAPVLSVGPTMTISDPAGNGNGRLDPGETVDISITSSNTGHADALNVIGSITSTSGYLTINSGSYELNTLNPAETATATFNVTAAADAPIGSTVDINYAVTSLFGYSAARTFTTKVGLILEDFESGGLTHFAWTHSGNANWSVTNVAPYEGIYSAKSGTIAASQTTDLKLVMSVTTADSISFYLKTSSESGYDYLKFYIDATSLGQWAGETPWTKVTFPVSAGSHTFKWQYMKDGSVTSGSDCAWIDYIVFPAAAPTAASVAGAVTYANTANTPLAGLTIKLKNNGGTVVATTTTNAAGNYTFNAVTPGNYTLEVITIKAWGGVSAADVLLYRKHIANITLLTGIYLASGDVNASGGISAADVLLIKKRIANITTSFTVGDWLFNNTPFTVGGGSVTQNFKGICYGDANASYIPVGKSLQANHQGMIRLESVAAEKGDITVPVVISGMTNLGSFQFTVQYDPSRLTLGDVTNWYQDIDAVTIGTPAPGLITFVWAADFTGVTIRDGVLCNLHFTSNSAESSSLEFVTAPTSQEFGDFDGVIFEPQVVNGALKSTTGIGQTEQSTLQIYPNPASGQATITYSVPSAKDVTITILNLLGQEVSTLLNTPEQTAGTYNVSFNVNGLNPGIYYCRLSVNNQVIVKKLIVNK